ncbi:MAG: acetyl-CoA carboxylase, carboxyltransferase subunit beta [Endomicrobiia bacterium]
MTKKVQEKTIQVPKDIWEKCPKCDKIVLKKELEENLKICPKCENMFRMTVKERVEMLTDDGRMEEFAKEYVSGNPLSFPDYDLRLKDAISKSGLTESFVCGVAKIGEIKVVLGILDFHFMGGSMGSVVGEKVALSLEKGYKEKLPVVIVSASGGARMQEGILSLMQMAKTSAAVAKYHSIGLPYISVLTDPTTGGVTASFSMLGDINIAESNALIGFAGPRVIEQTIKEKLPQGFQSSEFLLEHGFVDVVVSRKELKNTLVKILKLCMTNRNTIPTLLKKDKKR